MKQAPFWWPNDIRAWASIGMFAIVFTLLAMVYTKPQLADNDLFKTLATLLVGTGGFGLLVSFLWGGTKSSAGAVEAMTAMASGPQQVTVTNPPSQPVPVEPQP